MAGFVIYQSDCLSKFGALPPSVSTKPYAANAAKVLFLMWQPAVDCVPWWQRATNTACIFGYVKSPRNRWRYHVRLEVFRRNNNLVGTDLRSHRQKKLTSRSKIALCFLQGLQAMHLALAGQYGSNLSLSVFYIYFENAEAAQHWFLCHIFDQWNKNEMVFASTSTWNILRVGHNKFYWRFLLGTRTLLVRCCSKTACVTIWWSRAARKAGRAPWPGTVLWEDPSSGSIWWISSTEISLMKWAKFHLL